MNCEKHRINISAWLDGELTDEEYHELTRHMKECNECSAEFKAAQAFHASCESTFQTAEDYTPSAEVWNRIEKRITDKRPRVIIQSFRYFAAAAAVTAACILILRGPAETNGLVCESLTSEEALAADLAGAVLMSEENVDLDDIVATSLSRQAINQVMQID